MARQRRKDAPSPALGDGLTGRCLVCFQPARDSTAAEVPEISPFNGSKISGDQLEHHARERLAMKTGCITFWKSGISICGTTGIVGAAGDTHTEATLRAMAKVKGPRRG